MFEKVARGVFWIISLGMFGLSIYGLMNREFVTMLSITIVLGVITNPYIEDWITKKIGAKKNDYVYALQLLLIWAAVLIAFIVAAFVWKITSSKTLDENTLMLNFRATYKVIVFLTYLVILFACRNRDKFGRYIIFGAFYCLCVIISYVSEQFTELILVILNGVANSKLDINQYDILVNDILSPIKEAILAFIIFETVLKEKDNNSKEFVMRKNKFTLNVWDRLNKVLTVVTLLTAIIFIVLFILCFTTPVSNKSYSLIIGMCGVFASLASAFFIAVFIRIHDMDKKRQQELKALSILTPSFREIYTIINGFFPQIKTFVTIKDNDMIDYSQEKVYYTDEDNDNGNRSFIDFNKEFCYAKSKLDLALEECLKSPMIFQCNESILNLLTEIKLNGFTRNLHEVQAAPSIFNYTNTAYMSIYKNYLEFSDLYDELSNLLNENPNINLRELNDTEKELYIKEIDNILPQLPTTKGVIYMGGKRIN